MKTHNITKEAPGTPLKAFDTFQILFPVGWKNIAADINSLGNILIFPSSGLVLCAFAISYIDRTPTFKLPHITLDQGTECIKQLKVYVHSQNPYTCNNYYTYKLNATKGYYSSI